ncbi:MAG: Spy/CpxP family protein refolding chaperone [Gammaproteobacteria bacterium]|jgi:Spy/CpxP family protein refolding chaperone
MIKSKSSLQWIAGLGAALVLSLGPLAVQADESNDTTPPPGYGPGMMHGYGYGPGMMGQGSGRGPGTGYGYGRGMGYGYGMGYGMGPGMMGYGGMGYGMGPGMMMGYGGMGYGMGPGMMMGYGGMGYGPGYMRGGINLTDKQIEKMAELREKHAQAIWPLMGEMRSLRFEMMRQMSTEKPDQKAIDRSVDKMSALAKRMIKLRLQGRREMLGVLTDKQREQLKSMYPYMHE